MQNVYFSSSGDSLDAKDFAIYPSCSYESICIMAVGVTDTTDGSQQGWHRSSLFCFLGSGCRGPKRRFFETSR